VTLPRPDPGPYTLDQPLPDLSHEMLRQATVRALAELQKAVADLSATQRTQATHAELITALQGAVHTFTTEVQTAATYRTQTDLRLTTAEQATTDVQTSLAALRADVTALQSDVTVLQQAVADLGARVTALESPPPAPTNTTPGGAA
jgi:chromosome segregation ATPase